MNRPDELTNFLYWFLNEPIGLIKTPDEPRALTVHESVTTLTLYRKAPYQVELVILHPNRPAWPGEHRHPNVDTYEVAWFNTLNLTKNGKIVAGPELNVPVQIGPGIFVHVECVRLLPSDWHGAQGMPAGSCLLSVQRWLNGVAPTSVGMDWEGEPTTEGHAELLKERGNSAGSLPLVNVKLQDESGSS